MSKQLPAGFIMRNSRGYPDFIMTLLVYFSLALFTLLIIWVLLQYCGLRFSLRIPADGTHPFMEFMHGFNETIRLIIISLSGSIFGLAGSYLLRRKFYDDHYLEKQKRKGSSHHTEIHTSGFVTASQSSLQHSNYDDEEEDI